MVKGILKAVGLGRYVRYIEFTENLVSHLDTGAERDAALDHALFTMNEDGQWSVAEWSGIGSLLGVLGKK